MIKLPRSLVPALASLVALAGCVDQPGTETRDLDEPVAAAAPAAVADAAVRVEQAERALDVGRDIASARATLKTVVADKAAPVEVRDRAALSLSRAHELALDPEGAVVAVEDLLAAHADDHQWAGQDAAERRLRKLLTGKDERATSPRRPTDKASPFAHALAVHFPSQKNTPVEISILAFGGDGHTSDQLGTFHVGDALREIAQQACPLCETGTKVHTHSSRSDSWAAIPGAKGRLATSLAVFYTHLGDPIPARYDSLLPVPMAEVTAHLQKGEALVIARERPGAPPAILIAAPREAQLAEVEEALSRMKTLPGSLTVVKVSQSLKPAEIQTIVRSAGMPTFSKCYEALLSRAPTAAGKLDLRFVIRADGSVESPQLDASDALDDAAFGRCMVDATSALRFPAAGAPTTVKYPVELSPGDDRDSKQDGPQAEKKTSK